MERKMYKELTVKFNKFQFQFTQIKIENTSQQKLKLGNLLAFWKSLLGDSYEDDI